MNGKSSPMDSIDPNYEQAKYCFVHRDFAKTQALLGTHGPGPSTPAWVLYFALCDRAFIEPESPDWPQAERKELRVSVQHGRLWLELEERCDAVSAPVPPVLILSSFKLAEKYTEDPRPIVAFMEHVMALGPVAPDVFAAYVMQILVGLQHDFYYARQLVTETGGADQQDQQDLLQQIDTAEETHEHELVQKLRWEREQEQRRLDEAIKAASPAPSETGQPDDDTTVAQTAQSVQPAQPAASGNGVEDTEKAQNAPARRRPGLTGVWKQWLHEFVRSQGLFNALALAILLAGLASSRQARASLMRGRNWLYSALKSGLKMALSVTYL